MEDNKRFYVILGACIVILAAGVVYKFFSYGNSVPFTFALKTDGKLAITRASTPTPLPTFPTPTPAVQSQPVHTDKGIIEYLLGCEMMCP